MNDVFHISYIIMCIYIHMYIYIYESISTSINHLLNLTFHMFYILYSRISIFFVSTGVKSCVVGINVWLSHAITVHLRNEAAEPPRALVYVYLYRYICV